MYNEGKFSLEEENITKKTFFRLKKRKNLFRLEKESKAIKERIFRDIKTRFEL